MEIFKNRKIMKNEKYLNFFGDTQDYKIRPVPPNPYGMRGNPDVFDWEMDQEGDGLNGTPDYQDFNGGGYSEQEYSNHPGFIGGFGEKVGGWFKRSDDKKMQLPDGDGGYNEYTWGEIQADSNLMNLYTTNQDLKGLKRKEWWKNLGNNLGNFTTSFSDSYGQTQSGTNPLLQGPNPNITINPNENEPKQAGMGTGKIIGWVLVGGVVIGLLIYAMKGDGGKTIVVQQPSPTPVR